MADPLEVWVLIAVNFFGFFLAAILTVLSYYAYQSGEKKTSLRNATAGFGLLTVGTAIEPMYQVGIEGTPVLASDQNITLQLIEGAVISLGFFALFFSIYRYSSRSQRRSVAISRLDDDYLNDLD